MLVLSARIFSTKLIVIALSMYWFTIYEVPKVCYQGNAEENPAVVEPLKHREPISEFNTRRHIVTTLTKQGSRNQTDKQRFKYTRGNPRKWSKNHQGLDNDNFGDSGLYETGLDNVHRNNIHKARFIGPRQYRNRRFHNYDRNFRKSMWPKHYRDNILKWPLFFPRNTRRTNSDSNRTFGNSSNIEDNNNQINESIILSSYSIASQIEKIMSNFPHANMSTVVVKRTIEYNDILLLKITGKEKEKSINVRASEGKYVNEIPEKNIVFIVHALSIMGIHHLACLWKEEYLIKLFSFYLAHLDKFDIFIIPMANPDGYQASAPLWNKNFSPQDACAGVALDRNFDVAWKRSNDITSCSQQYPGPAPFSEPETQAIREVFHNYSHKIIAYLHVHSGTYSFDTFKGDAVLYPRGYTHIKSDDEKYMDLKGEIDEALRNASFQVVSVAVGTLHNWYGKVYGTSVDYASTIYGIPFAMELVMQSYKTISYSSLEDFLDYIALNEVWSRVINVIFNNIWKYTQANEVR